MQPPATASQNPLVVLPELLAPAGDWECARAAVENGADAIYFGLDRFNARMRAQNFTEADLPQLMAFLHERGVKGYVTFNTLVFTDELADALQYLRSIIAAGVDAAIVQDVGMCRMIRELSPDFHIHGSTQMTVTSAAGVKFAEELGCNLVVLARECSISEIEKIQAVQKAAAMAPLPLEVFVHGALCVAYSGQCLTSESLGGRSANRGECAQACRMTYDLISDGQQVPMGDRRYLLSPQDLSGLEVLPELVRTGVTSLKIEGRLKTPEYVANVTRIYRQALDKAAGSVTSTPANAKYDLEMAFSRGLYTGWFKGNNNQELVHARFGKKRGVYLGSISRVDFDTVVLQLEAPLKPGDGVVFDAGRPDLKEQGGRVYTVRDDYGQARLGFGHGSLDYSQIHVGDRLWKTSDPELDRRLKASFDGDQPRFHQPLHFEVHGGVQHPMTIIARDDQGHIAQKQSNIPLQAAEKHALDHARLEGQLGRLGGTPFRMGRLQNQLEGACMLPVSELNRLRRELVEAVLLQRRAPKKWKLNENAPTDSLTNVESSTPVEQRAAMPGEIEFIPLVRTMEQLEAALKAGSRSIYCEFEDPKRYREAVTTVRTSGSCRTDPPTIWVAPPRITKEGEAWILNQVRSCDADGYLVRNYDHLEFFKSCRKVGDFSLNVANPLTARYFLERFGLERLTASYDLNVTQLEALINASPKGWFEITLHQHMPMFHMEHCVFCAFLSSGTDYKNCGRPCDKHQVRLRDRIGMEHTLKADAGCRNTVFNAQAQTGAENFERFVQSGISQFRIEFMNESGDQVLKTLGAYRKLARGETTGSELWRELKLVNQLGVTRGQLFKP